MRTHYLSSSHPGPQTQHQPDTGVVTCLALDASWIVVGLASSRIHVFSAKTGVLARTLVGHDSGVWGLCLVSALGRPRERKKHKATTELWRSLSRALKTAVGLESDCVDSDFDDVEDEDIHTGTHRNLVSLPFLLVSQPARTLGKKSTPLSTRATPVLHQRGGANPTRSLSAGGATRSSECGMSNAGTCSPNVQTQLPISTDTVFIPSKGTPRRSGACAQCTGDHSR